VAAVYQRQLSVPSFRGRLMSTSESWGVNGHTTRCTSPVSVVLQLNVVTGQLNLAHVALTLIHPASNWTHWATLRRHPCLSRAATSASSQVNPSFVGLSWLCPSSSLLVDLVLSWILVPASTVLAVVCAGGSQKPKNRLTDKKLKQKHARFTDA